MWFVLNVGYCKLAFGVKIVVTSQVDCFDEAQISVEEPGSQNFNLGAWEPWNFSQQSEAIIAIQYNKRGDQLKVQKDVHV